MSALIPLAVLVPPMLEQALGYDHEIDSRLVAFYWTPSGDELMYDDGQRAGDGEWHAWLLFVHHRAVAPHLIGRQLGNSDEPAREWLILDRRARRVYIAPAAQARAHLHEQWDRFAPAGGAAATLDGDTLRGLLEAALWREEWRPDAEVMAEVQARMAAQRRLEDELAAWLDARAAPGEGAGHGN